jgi:hypothetical protein
VTHEQLFERYVPIGHNVCENVWQTNTDKINISSVNMGFLFFFVEYF